MPEAMPGATAGRRGTYGPVAGTGVLAAALVATFAGRALVDVEGGAAVAIAAVGTDERGTLPLAMTLSLVVLACWGVVLVTRRWVRAGAAVLGALAALAALVTVAIAWWVLPDALREDLRALGVDVEPRVTATYWITLVAAVVSAAASLAAVVLVRRWPAMGTRYDRTPGSDEPRATPAEDDDLALWKALDDGRDPTA